MIINQKEVRHNLLFHEPVCALSEAKGMITFMIEECSEQESASLIPIIESVLSVLRAKRTIEIESDT